MNSFCVTLLLLGTLASLVPESSSVNPWMPWNWGKPRPVDGQWSAWTEWSTCQIPSNPDSLPFRYKERNCSNPAPKNGAANCKGESQRNSSCYDCNMPLGLESGRVQDSFIRASHSHKYFPSYHARLNSKSAWCSMNPDTLEEPLYLQIDLRKLTAVSAIASQGFYPPAEEMSLRMGRVSKYKLMYSTNGLSWSSYVDSKNETILRGNTKRNGTVLNVLSPEITARFIRVYPVSYFSFICMRLELYGCTFACGEALGVEPGFIMTKSSPTEDQDCLWHVDVPNITKLNMDFINFNLPCSYGFAELRDGNMPYSSATVLAHYCSLDSLPPLVGTNSGKLWVHFKSNASDPEVGFYSVYFPGCGGHLQGIRGEIISPNFPKEYFHNSKCIWTVTVPEGKLVRLKFVNFNVEGDANRQRCPHDALTVWNSSDSDASVIGKFCNSYLPPSTICSAGNTLRLKFHSDDALAYTGFNITFSELDSLASCFEMSSSISTSTRISSVVAHVTPTPSIAIQTVYTQQEMFPASNHLLEFAGKTSVLIPSGTSASVVTNGTMIVFPGVSVDVAAQRKKKDDDKDDGLWSVIILSVFSCVVLCMIIASMVPSIKKHYDKRKLEKELNLLSAPMLTRSIPKTDSKETLEGSQGPVRESSACEDEESMQSIDGAESKSLSATPSVELIPEKTEADQIIAIQGKGSCQEYVEGMVDYMDDVEEESTDTDAFIGSGGGGDDDDDDNSPEIGSLQMSYEDLGSSFAQEMQTMLGQLVKDDELPTWNHSILTSQSQSQDSKQKEESIVKKESDTSKSTHHALLPVQENNKSPGCDCRSETEKNHLIDPSTSETSV